MPKILILPDELSFELNEGETIFSAAARHKLKWPNTCGGDARCGLCAVEVTEGVENLSAIEDKEEKMLGRLRRFKPSPHILRLSCQTTACADFTVIKRGVKPFED